MQLPPARLRVNVEYCKSCDTHTWCTHHQQEKYFNTFQKLKLYLEQEFQSQVIVQGNVVPEDFVPIKSAQNKYYSQKTNKYVQFPITGAFQITIDGELVFSKKKTNTWPNLIDIGDKVHFKLYSTQRPHKQNEKSPSKQKKNSPTRKQQRLLSAEVDIKTQKDNRSQNNQSFLDNNDKRSTFYKSKSNYKNFTLTDHFKNYHHQDYKHPIHDSNRASEEFFTNNQTDNDQENISSEMGSFRQPENNQNQFLEFKKNFDAWTNSQSKMKLTQLIKRRGHMKEDGIGGKKQMIIRLDSIEEESILADQNGGGSIHQGQNNLLRTAYFNNTHSTFKSRKENTHKEIMNKFNAEFDELEEKFKNFQQKVEDIREENRKFDDSGDKKQFTRQGIPKIMNGRSFKQAKQVDKKNSRLKKSEIKDFKQDGSSEEQDMLNNPIIFAKRKLKNIEDYINGTEEEKNEKLKKIYGEWKLFGRPYKGKNYISPYKMDLLSRIETGQTNQKNPRKKNKLTNQDKDQDSSDDSSLMSSDAKQVRPKQGKSALNKSKMPRMPPMQPGKSPKGQQSMAQQFHPSSHDDFHEGDGVKKLKKKASQINSRSFDKLRQTQNLLHRAGAGLKVNTVDRMSQMQQKHQQGWGDKKGSFSNSFNLSKEKIIKNGRMLRSIQKAEGQGKILTKNNLKKLRRMNNSQKNMNRIVERDGQSKLIRKLQSKKENDQFIGSGHSDDSGQLFKNFRSKKSQNISKSKDKLVSQNQIPKKGRQIYLNREGSEDASHQQSYNNNEQSLENNYFNEVSSKKPKQQNINSQKDQRVKRQYEKKIGNNKVWRQSRIGSKQKKLSYKQEMQRSRSKNKSKQSRSFWMNSGEMAQQQRSSLIRQDHEEENQTSRPINKMQNTSLHEKSLEKQKLRRMQTDGDVGTQKDVGGNRKNKTYVDGEKQKKKKKRETIIQLKDLEKSGVGQQLLHNQSGSVSEPPSNQYISGSNQNSQVGSENEKIEKSHVKKGQNKLSQENQQIEQNQSNKKRSPQLNKNLKTQNNKQNKQNNHNNDEQEEDDFASFTQSKQVDQTEKQDENNELEGNQGNNKSIKKDGKKLKKNQKQKKNKNSSSVKNPQGATPKQGESQQEKQNKQEGEQQGQIESSQNLNHQQLNEQNKNTSQKQNQTSKKGKKLQNIKSKSNQPKNGEKEDISEQNDQQDEVDNPSQQKDAQNVKIKKSPKISKKKGKIGGIKNNKNQPGNEEEENANQQDNQEDENQNDGTQQKGDGNLEAKTSQKVSKKKSKKRQRKQQKGQNQNEDEDENDNENDNEDDEDEDENEDEYESENENQYTNQDANANEKEQEKTDQINRSEAPLNQQQQAKGDEKSKLRLKSHSKAIKQEASRALVSASGQTQRLNTARSVLSRNQIIGIYNDKDSEDNENSQILDNEEDQQGAENNQQNVQKRSPKKQRMKNKPNGEQQNPSYVSNKDPGTWGKQSKKWTQISIIQQADIQRPDSPQLELFNAEEKGQERKGKVGFQKEQNQNENENEKNEVDNMDQEELEESEEEQIVQGEIKGQGENLKSGRAPIIKQFYGESFKEQIKLFTSLTQQAIPIKNFTSFQNLIENLPQNSTVSQLPVNIISSNPRLFNRKSIEIQKITSNHPLPNLIKCLKILADINEFLIIRLFENPLVKITKSNVLKKAFGVWLCVNYEWNCVIIDLNQILLSSEGERGELKPFYLNHSNNQLWPIVLEAALAKALKSYKFLASLPCHKLFNILTGSNSLFFNIKQDPSKNSRILRYISDCENKNFILHAEKICKNLEELQRSEKETKIYYVLSQKLVNENEILLQIRESIRPDSQWMKLTKFVQEFKSIQILQLRLNHNFSSIKLPKPMNNNNLTIIELDYLEESFGSITLSTATGELCPILKTYLYKEEKSNVLKLVGEAKQKNKSTLFFDCFFGETRYYLFVESAVQSRVTYLGENQPLIKIIEEINSDGLKNDYTEYLPINSVSRNTQKPGNWGFRQMSLGPKMPNKLTKSRFGETGMSFKSQQDEKISRLRENFVEYLLKGTD